MSKVFENISIKSRNSFAIDVSAKKLIEFVSYDDLCQTLEDDKTILSDDWYLLAGGNNTLFTKNFDGTLLHPVSDGITIETEDGSSATVRAESGVEWDSLVEWCVERGLWGLENLSLIPGQVGAAPVQNIGAYGSEAKDVIMSVEMLDLGTLKKVTLANRHCSFAYRDSIFKKTLKGRVIITAVTFRLDKSAKPNLRYGALSMQVEKYGGATLDNIRRAVIETRRSKLPDPTTTGNAGSFFKNPVVDSALAQELKNKYPDIPIYCTDDPEKTKLAAGWLIEQAGWKGRRIGNAAVHDKQALVLVNATGKATGAEITALSNQIVQSIKERFNIEIYPEVNIL